MLLKEIINEGTKTISLLYPEAEAREMVFAFMEHAFGTKRHTHILEPDYSLGENDVEVARRAFSRMAAGEPLQYVTGVSYFYGRPFRVTPDVLIPRPETELLCRSVICGRGSEEGLRVLDLCTGSGCIAWTLALELPGSQVVAVDLSDGALAVASSQDFPGLNAPVFHKADVLEGPSDGFGLFDVIVSNPPYVMESEKEQMRPNVLEHEPEMALFVSDSDPLLFYRALARWCVTLLRPGGTAMVEINESLGPETAGIFIDSGFEDVVIVRDFSEKDRFVSFKKRK